MSDLGLAPVDIQPNVEPSAASTDTSIFQTLKNFFSSSPVVDSVGMVKPDNSAGAAPMSPSTPTGNGTGYFIDQTAQNNIFQTIEDGLNFALQRDQQKMQAPIIQAQAQATSTQTQQSMQNAKMVLFFGGAALLLFMLRKA